MPFSQHEETNQLLNLFSKSFWSLSSILVLYTYFFNISVFPTETVSNAELAISDEIPVFQVW